jgi:hypothetical protein
VDTTTAAEWVVVGRVVVLGLTRKMRAESERRRAYYYRKRNAEVETCIDT